MIPDIIKDIADEVRQFSKNYDLVLTSGGLGPTHDDVTMAGSYCIVIATETHHIVHPQALLQLLMKSCHTVQSVPNY